MFVLPWLTNIWMAGITLVLSALTTALFINKITYITVFPSMYIPYFFSAQFPCNPMAHTPLNQAWVVSLKYKCSLHSVSAIWVSLEHSKCTHINVSEVSEYRPQSSAPDLPQCDPTTLIHCPQTACPGPADDCVSQMRLQNCCFH